MKLWCLFLITPLLVIAAEDPYAAQLFQKHCASCHDSAAGATGRIPQVAVLKTMTPGAIQRTLENGVMKAQGSAFSADERMKLANFLGTPVTVERKRDEITNACPAGAAWSDAPSWSGWGGAGLNNTRF